MRVRFLRMVRLCAVTWVVLLGTWCRCCLFPSPRAAFVCWRELLCYSAKILLLEELSRVLTHGGEQ